MKISTLNVSILSMLIFSTLNIYAQNKNYETVTNDSLYTLIKDVWYQYPTEGYTIKYKKEEKENVSQINFKSPNELIYKNSRIKGFEKGKPRFYYMTDSFFNMQSTENDKIYTNYRINEISDTVINYTEIGESNSVKAVLCGNGYIFKIGVKMPTLEKDPDGFSKYMIKNYDYSIKPDDKNRLIIQFDVNCKGEVCNVRNFDKYAKSTPISNEITRLIINQPNWEAGIGSRDYANFQFVYMFKVIDNKLLITDVTR